MYYHKVMVVVRLKYIVSMKKILIYVNGHSDLITAIVLRKKVIRDEICDIAIGKIDLSGGLLNRLKDEKVFNNIYKVNTIARYHGSGLLTRLINGLDFLSPRFGVASCLGIRKRDVVIYDEIYYYDTDIFFDNFVRFQNYCGVTTKYHEFASALNCYLREGASREPRFKSKFINYVNFKRFGYLGPQDLSYDVYMRYPEKAMYERKHDVHVLPQILLDDEEMLGLLNRIWGYSKNKKTNIDSIKYLFFDTGADVALETKISLDIIDRIGQCLPKESFWIKPKPGYDKNRYEKIGYYILDEEADIPFELFYMNNDISSVVLITSFSSAVLQPFIVSALKAPIWCVAPFYYNTNSQYKELAMEMTRFFRNMKSELDIEVFDNTEEILEIIGEK